MGVPYLEVSGGIGGGEMVKMRLEELAQLKTKGSSAIASTMQNVPNCLRCYDDLAWAGIATGPCATYGGHGDRFSLL